MLDARSIALQGIGYDPRVIALQGFADVNAHQWDTSQGKAGVKFTPLQAVEIEDQTYGARSWVLRPRVFTDIFELPVSVHVMGVGSRVEIGKPSISATANIRITAVTGKATGSNPIVSAHALVSTAAFTGLSAGTNKFAASAGANVKPRTLPHLSYTCTPTCKTIMNPSDEELILMIQAARRARFTQGVKR